MRFSAEVMFLPHSGGAFVEFLSAARAISMRCVGAVWVYVKIDRFTVLGMPIYGLIYMEGGDGEGQEETSPNLVARDCIPATFTTG
jgi:hypothetical protein